MSKPNSYLPNSSFILCYNGVDFGIPLRSNIKHLYYFKTSEIGGIDFSKSVIIPDKKYILPIKPVIREEEFKIIKGKEYIFKINL